MRNAQPPIWRRHLESAPKVPPRFAISWTKLAERQARVDPSEARLPHHEGRAWFAEGSFPRVITEKLVLASTVRGPALFAFTHVRGAWRADLVETPRRRAVR